MMTYLVNVEKSAIDYKEINHTDISWNKTNNITLELQTGIYKLNNFNIDGNTHWKGSNSINLLQN